jgi:hypothetical protein
LGKAIIAQQGLIPGRRNGIFVDCKWIRPPKPWYEEVVKIGRRRKTILTISRENEFRVTGRGAKMGWVGI